MDGKSVRTPTRNKMIKLSTSVAEVNDEYSLRSDEQHLSRLAWCHRRPFRGLASVLNSSPPLHVWSKYAAVRVVQRHKFPSHEYRQLIGISDFWPDPIWLALDFQVV